MAQGPPQEATPEASTSERVLRKLRHHWLVVSIGLIAAFFSASAQFVGAFNTLENALFPDRASFRFETTIQAQDFIAGPIGDVRAIGEQRANGDNPNLRALASAIVSDIGDALPIRSDIPEWRLEADGTVLRTVPPIDAFLLIVEGESQLGRITFTALSGATVDLKEWMWAALVNASCRCIPLSLRPPGGIYEREYLEIHPDRLVFPPGASPNEATFDLSFARGRSEPSRVVRFRPRMPRILIEVEVIGGESSLNARVSQELANTLQDALLKRQDLRPSPINRAELAERRKDIVRLDVGATKEALIAQYEVDHIVKVTGFYSPK